MNDYEIKKLYEDMELYLIQSMKRNLGRHLTEENKVGFKFTQWQAEKLKELKRYQRENKKIIGRYTLGLDKDVSEHLQNELKQGSISAIKQYNKALGKDLKPSKVMNKSFFQTNDKKVNALIKVVNDDLKTANTSALRMMNDQYRQIIHKSAFFVGNGVFTEKQAAAQAVDEISQKKLTTLAIDESSKNFLAGGLNCIEYSDGRRVNIASYSQMAVRTASLRTHLMGEGNFRASIGRTLVKVTTHGGACPLCTEWQGKVLIDDVYSGGKPDGKHTLLSDAMKQGFLHPNCRHGITTYYPELEEDEEEVGPVNEETEETQQQFNYANRNVKRYRRLEMGSLDSSNIKKNKTLKDRWIHIRKNISNSIYDLKTNENPPLKLYQIPDNYYSKIKDIIDHSPKTMKKLINDNIDKFRFKNIQTRKTSRYDSIFNNIKVNLKKDAVNPTGSYRTLFHEMSHNLDVLLGNLSQDGTFEKLLRDDFDSLKKKYMVIYKVNEESAYKEIGKKLKKSDKLNSVSDIIGGITNNKCYGKATHTDKYWKTKGMLGREAFAHFGSAVIRQNPEELEYIKQVFPNAYEHFKKSLIKVGGNK